jgi:type II secretory pathway component PulF
MTNKELKEFLNEMEIGLKEGLKIAKAWDETNKFYFIKGQLDMLRKVRNKTGNLEDKIEWK